MDLYHYTTAQGLEGIITTRSVWASDYRFLNDATEFRYGLNIFEQTLASPRSQNISPEAMDLITRFLAGKSEFSVFIAAFSQQPDLLSQWRGYNNGRGYAIGINADWLTQNAEAQNFSLVPVVYTISDQQRVLNDKLGLLNSLLAERARKESTFDTVTEWWRHMLFVIAALKNEHFAEEDEYRLVKVANGWPKGVRTRPTPRGLVPYISFKLDEKIIDHPSFHRNNLGFERIIVEPALTDEQKQAVDALLASAHMRISIEKSAIPYVAD